MRLSERRHQLATGDLQKSRRKKAITDAAAGSSHQQHPKSGNIIFSVGKREGKGIKEIKREKRREGEIVGNMQQTKPKIFLMHQKSSYFHISRLLPLPSCTCMSLSVLKAKLETCLNFPNRPKKKQNKQTN